MIGKTLTCLPPLPRASLFVLAALQIALPLGLAAPQDAPTPRIDHLRLGKTRLALVRIPAGTFSMGTDQVIRADDSWDPCPSCPPRNDVENPAHQVTISRDFWMGQFDVTQAQWQEVMGDNPSHHRSSPDAPVEQVSWNDAQKFIARVNAAQKDWIVRLPTEAEWEYAARAGSTGETYGPLDSIAWYHGNASGATQPVGKKRPNAFDLYDVLGNVWQWCQDWFGPYSSAPAVDPKGPPTGDRRVTRGGCYYCEALQERAARRNRDLVDHVSASIGFRIAAEPKTAAKLRP